jgi:hypothetical protein
MSHTCASVSGWQYWSGLNWSVCAQFSNVKFDLQLFISAPPDRKILIDSLHQLQASMILLHRCLLLTGGRGSYHPTVANATMLDFPNFSVIASLGFQPRSGVRP